MYFYFPDTLRSSFERLKQLKYLGTTLTNQNSIKEEIKSRFKPGNAYCISVQNLFSTSLLSKILKIKIYNNIILPVVSYGCEIWSLILMEERRLRLIQNRSLRRTFRPKINEVKGDWS
jgi:hypothetical protein